MDCPNIDRVSNVNIFANYYKDYYLLSKKDSANSLMDLSDALTFHSFMLSSSSVYYDIPWLNLIALKIMNAAITSRTI